MDRLAFCVGETNLTDKLLDSLGKEKRRSDQRKDTMKPTSAVILC